MIPTLILSGDTVIFDWSHADYPVSSWTAKLLLVGPSTLTVTATTNDDDFRFTISATQSGVLKPGLYNFALRVFSSDEAYTLESGQLEVKPNLANSPTKIALAERMIDLIEKALMNQLSDGEALEAMSIAGRSLTSINRMELLKERSLWYRERNTLKNAQFGNGGIRIIGLSVTKI